MGGMGGPPAMPPPPPKLIKPSKKELKTDKKLRPYIWKRVIIDRDGVYCKNEVAHPDLNKINPDWQGKRVIW